MFFPLMIYFWIVLNIAKPFDCGGANLDYCVQKVLRPTDKT